MPALSFHFACCSHWFYKTEIVLFAEKPARVVYKPHYERNLCVSHRITYKTRNEISYKRLVVANQLLSGAWLFRTRAFHEAWNKKKNTPWNTCIRTCPLWISSRNENVFVHLWRPISIHSSTKAQLFLGGMYIVILGVSIAQPIFFITNIWMYLTIWKYFHSLAMFSNI